MAAVPAGARRCRLRPLRLRTASPARWRLPTWGRSSRRTTRSRSTSGGATCSCGSWTARKEATSEAARLVDEAVDKLTASLKSQKEALSGDNGEDTEKLRVELRGYRDILNRILDL